MDRYNFITYFKQHSWWMLLLFYIGLQIPLLQADPDRHLSHSRDAHTDEGLNTSQLRNYINTGKLDIWECDNWVKNPLYNFILYTPFKIFGTKWLVGRITILSLIVLSFCWIAKNSTNRSWLCIFILTSLFQYHILQYTHFVMAEALAMMCIVLSIFFFSKALDKEYKRVDLILGIVLMNLAWWMKIQFIYTLGILFMIFIYALFQNKLDRKIVEKVVLFGIITFGFIGLYIILWYFPQREAFEYMMNNQTSHRYLWEDTWNYIEENYYRHFTTIYVKNIFWIFLGLIPFSIVVFRTIQKNYLRHIYWISIIWVLYEIHKICMHHVPSRYMVSMYMAIALYISVVLYALIKSDVIWKKILGISFFSFLFITYGITYNYIFTQRTFDIKNVNAYFQEREKENMTIVGAWAPTATWGTKIKSMPVWRGYLNDVNIKEKLNPDAVIIEPGESDSDLAYCFDQFPIDELASEKTNKTISKWQIQIYWIK